MTKFRIMTLSIKDRITTQWITTSIIECHYTECHNLLKVMLIVVMLSVAAKKKLLYHLPQAYDDGENPPGPNVIKLFVAVIL
jgi:hypothetical protein